MNTNNPDAEQILLGELRERFAKLKDAYHQLDAQADVQIVRWRYALRSAFELQADYHRRFNEAPGVQIDEEPIDETIFYAYGYDAQNRLVYDAFFQTEELPRTARYYRYETNYVEVAEFGHFDLYSEHYRLNKVARRVQPAGEKAQHYASYQELHERIIQYHEVYDYDDRGRLLRVRKHTQSHSAQTPDDLNRALQPALEQQRQLAHLFGTEDLFEQTMGAALKNMMTQELQSQDYHEEDLYEYESETLKRIYTPGPLATTLHYEARQPDETDDLLFQTARDRLREHIIAYLKQHPPRERLYLLTLSYDAVCDDGVSLVLGWEQWRDEWHQRVEEPSYPELFLEQMSNVGPDDAFRSLPEPLPAAYERFIREMRGVHNWEAIRDMMVQVAQDLNQADWHGILETTDDFIVIANDYEAMNDPLDDIRASVPAEKLRILQAKGWIETK